MTGLPTKIAFAPYARHLRTSVPLVMDESMNISVVGLSLLFTAFEIDFKTLIVDGEEYGLAPPLFEIQTASAPFDTASRASSLHMIPFTTTLRPFAYP